MFRSSVYSPYLGLGQPLGGPPPVQALVDAPQLGSGSMAGLAPPGYVQSHQSAIPAPAINHPGATPQEATRPRSNSQDKLLPPAAPHGAMNPNAPDLPPRPSLATVPPGALVLPVSQHVPHPAGVAGAPPAVSVVESKPSGPKHPMSVRIEKEFEYLECGREALLKSLITLKAEEDFPMPKPNLDLVVLINRSTSADMLFNFKHAVEYLLSQLGQHDRMAVIAYEETVNCVVPLDYVVKTYESTTSTWAAVDSISVGNGKSNLSAGLKSALELVEASSRTRLAVSAVLILTDASPNCGTTDVDDLIKEVGLASAQQRRELRISQRLPQDLDYPWVVHSFGCGLSHDAAGLSAIANASKGVYSYVPGGNLVANAVADCFGGLASSVALRVEVAIRPAIGCDLKSVKTCYKSTEYENGLVVDVGDLHRGESTNILVELNLQALEGVPVGEQQLVDIHIKYLDLRFFEAAVAATRLYTSIDVFRPEVCPKQLKNHHLDLQQFRFATYDALKQAVVEAGKGNKARVAYSYELSKLSQKIEVSDVFEAKLSKSLVRDLRNCAELLRHDRTEEYIHVLWTTLSQQGMERSVGHPLDDFYATSSRAHAQLRVGRSLRHSLARLLESAKYSDVTVAGHKLHKSILAVRCPAILALAEDPKGVAPEDQDAFKVLLRFVYTGEYVAQRKGPREKVVDVKFRILLLARKLDLPVLAANAMKELIAFSRLDILVVVKAWELGEKEILEHWVYKFVYEPDGGALAQQEHLAQVPFLVPRIVKELRAKDMRAPEEVKVPEREPLSADIISLLNSGLEADLQLKVIFEGTTVVFPVHRCVLFTRCPWFSFKDLSKPFPISIPPRAFRQLLVYLYSEEPPFDVVDALHILGSFATAGIESLSLAKATAHKINPTNCYVAYNLASRLQLRGLSKVALEVISANFSGTTSNYVETTQSQINELRGLVHSLAARVQQLEDGGNKVSDTEDDRD